MKFSTSTASNANHRPSPRQVHVAEFEQHADVFEHFVEVALAGINDAMVSDQDQAVIDRIGFSARGTSALTTPWPREESTANIICLNDA